MARRVIGRFLAPFQLATEHRGMRVLVVDDEPAVREAVDRR
jgi:hypothetical protein